MHTFWTLSLVIHVTVRRTYSDLRDMDVITLVYTLAVTRITKFSTGYWGKPVLVDVHLVDPGGILP